MPEAQKSKMRDTPWGRMSYIEYKWKMEFDDAQIKVCEWGGGGGSSSWQKVKDTAARHRVGVGRVDGSDAWP